MDLTRRNVLRAGGAAALAAGVLGLRTLRGTPVQAATPESFEVTHTDDEWRKLLTGGQYDILRRQGTERPYSSPLNSEHRPGVFACAGCQLDAFSSKTKFESGTGWPSF